MESKIINNTEKTVEYFLKKIIKRMNSQESDALKVGAWVFNSEYGSEAFSVNKPVELKGKQDKEVIASYHAEQQVINSVPKNFWLKGQNTIFVTLIPCIECIKYLEAKAKVKGIKQIHVIYFVDHLDKSPSKRYKEYEDVVPMVKYKNSKDMKINELIDKIEKYHIKFMKQQHPKEI